MRSQLVDIMKTLKMPLVSCGSNWDVVRKSITAAYAHSPNGRLKTYGRVYSAVALLGHTRHCVPLPRCPQQRKGNAKPQLYSLQRSSTAQHCRHSVAHCAATGSSSLQVGKCNAAPYKWENAMRLLTSGKMQCGSLQVDTSIG